MKKKKVKKGKPNGAEPKKETTIVDDLRPPEEVCDYPRSIGHGHSCGREMGHRGPHGPRHWDFDPALGDPIEHIPPEKFHYPGRPSLSIPPQVWTQPEPKVVCVAGCFHCSYRRYYGTMPPAVAFNRMWCSHCGADRIFIPLPKSQWDSYAGGANDSVQTNKEDPSTGKDS